MMRLTTSFISYLNWLIDVAYIHCNVWNLTRMKLITQFISYLIWLIDGVYIHENFKHQLRWRLPLNLWITWFDLKIGFATQLISCLNPIGMDLPLSFYKLPKFDWSWRLHLLKGFNIIKMRLMAQFMSCLILIEVEVYGSIYEIFIFNYLPWLMINFKTLPFKTSWLNVHDSLECF